jgi:La domain
MTATRIAKQLEFYFSDANLATDKFLSQELQNTVEGWIPISVLLSFNRMKQLQADASSSLAAVANSEFLEVDIDGQRLRRKIPFVPGLSSSNVQNTLHISGFPTHLTLDDLEKYFEQQALHPLVIRLRKDMKTKEFMGKVFFECENREQADSVIQKGLMFDNVALDIETKQDWLSRHDKKHPFSTKQQSAAVKEPLNLDQLVKLEGVSPGTSFGQIKVLRSKFLSLILKFV